MKKLLIAFIKLLINPRIIIGLIIILLMGMVWFGGEMVGLKERETQLIIILFILALGIILFLIERLIAVRRSNMLESSLMQQAEDQVINTRPDHREEIETMKKELTQAINALKTTRLGKGLWGNSALYAIPWYMIIGPPGSGKSTAIRHSGLNFPYLGQSESGIKGVGGTRNCDWWFADQAIILDTAGRYMTDDENKEEWLAFLDFLRKHRKRTAINGVIIAISIADIVRSHEDELESHANKIRLRIDELIKKLGIIFPVYLIFTKCDLLRGFVDSFNDMNKTERSQVWGCTLTKKQQEEYPQTEKIFENEFDRLYKILCSRRLTRLSSVISIKKKENVYTFPLQFSYTRNRLSKFISLLFRPNPYQENPCLRGFYFTSGTQEGMPIDQILNSVSRASGISEDLSDPLEQNKEKKSYFIKKLFTDVIFQDKDIVYSSSDAKRYQGTMRIAAFAVSFTLLILFLTGLSFSFIKNSSLIHRTFSAAEKLMGVRGDDFASDIKRLEDIRRYLVRLDQYERDGVPFLLNLGLYQGTKINNSARKIYFSKFKENLLFPTGQVIELRMRELIRMSSNNIPIPYEEAFTLLKTYLMLSSPFGTTGSSRHIDKGFIATYLYKLWSDNIFKRVYTNKSFESLQNSLSNQIEFYISQIGREDTPFLESNETLIKSLQSALKRLPLSERIFFNIKQEGVKRFEPLTLKSMMYGIKNNSLIGEYEIPGIFSKKAWREFVKDAVIRMSEKAGEEDWVLGVSPDSAIKTGNGRLIDSVNNLYFKEYIREWRNFLVSLNIRKFEDLKDTLIILEELSSKDSPLIHLFKEVSINTEKIDDKGLSGIKTASKGIVSSVKEALRFGGQKEETSGKLAVSPLYKEFKGLLVLTSHLETESDKGSPKEYPIDIYLQELSRLRNRFKEIYNSDDSATNVKELAKEHLSQSSGGDLRLAWRSARDILDRLEIKNRDAVRSIIEGPIINSWTLILTITQKNLNQLWNSEVYRPFQMSLEDRYPFNSRGEDASLIDMGEFFRPDDGTFWKFFNNELKAFMSYRGDKWQPKKWINNSIRISEEFKENLKRTKVISETIFPKGSLNPGVSFEVYPYPTSGVSEILLQTDGQSVRYRNQPQRWYKLSWPGSGLTKGAKLQITSDLRYTKSYDGDWGIFRLLDDAQIMPLTTNTYRIKWILRSQQGKNITIQYDLRAESYKNPFGSQKDYTGFKTPEKIG